MDNHNLIEYNPHKVARRFERMFPEIAYQEHLRSTDPERYRQHMNTEKHRRHIDALRDESIDYEESRVISVIVYDTKNRKIRFEKPKR